MRPVEKQTGLKALFSNSYYGGAVQDVYPGMETYLKRCQKIGTFGVTHCGRVTEELFRLYEKYDMSIVNDCMAGNMRDKSGKAVLVKGDQRGFAIFTDAPYRKGAELLVKDYRLEGDGTLTPEWLDKFKSAVSTTVKKYPWIPRWSFSGEDEAKWPEWLANNMEDYAKINIAFYEGVKAANPQTGVYNGPPCNINLEAGVKAVDNLLRQINGRIKFDALSCHTYLPEGPYALDADIEGFLCMAAKYGYKDTPVFFPEGMHYGPYNIPQLGIVSASWGPPQTWYYGTLSYDMGWTERLSAAWFARSWLVMMKHNGRVISGCSGAVNMISNFHLDAKLTPRAYQKVPNTLSNLLGDAKFVKDLSFSPETPCLVFEDGSKRPVAAVWSEILEVDQGLKDCPAASADFGASKPELFDLMETKRDFKAEFPLAPFPCFIRGAAGSLDSFCKAVSNARITGGDIAPFKIISRLISPEKIGLDITNYLSRKIDGTLSAGKFQKELVFQPLEKIRVDLDSPVPLSAGEIKKINIPVSLREKDGGAPVSKDFNFEAFLSKRTSAPRSLSDLDDWKDIPAVPLKNRWLAQKTEFPKDDFDGCFKTAWDKDFLYIVVVIKDNVFVHEEFKNPAQRWNNDSLQIFIDSRANARDKKTSGYDTDDYDYAVFPDSKGEKSVVFRYRSPDRQLTLGTEAPPDMAIEPNIPSAFKRTADGYVYGIKIPAKYLLPAKLEKNYSMGICVYVNDRDDGKNVKQALTLTPNGTGGHMRPHLYPVMLLAD
jgi:hypothetical protein